MIKVLKNYIGCKYINDDPSSGITVNAIPGINTKQLEKISEHEKDTMSKAWEDIENNAIRAFESDLLNAFKRYMKHYTDVMNIHFGNFQSDETLTASEEYIGYFINLRAISPNLKVMLSRVSFNLLSAQTFDLKVFDLLTGAELFTKNVAGAQGFNIVQLNKEFESVEADQIFVAVNNTAGDFIPVQESGRKLCSLWKSSNAAAPVVDALDLSESAPFGISFSIACSLDHYISTRMNFFTHAFLLKVAIEFVKERRHSDRINRYTLLNNKQAEELQQELEKDYKECLAGVLKDLKAPEDGFCFTCNQAVTRVNRIP